MGPKGGRREKHPRRRIVEAILYLARTGCQWRYLPHDFPPWETVYWYFTRWHDDGTVEKIHNALRVKAREADGRRAEPTARLVDSQSVRAADTVPAEASGFDAGKKTKGRKQFVATDTLGLLPAVHVAAASVQDRDGARRPLPRARLDHPTVEKVRADQGFAGRLVTWAGEILERTVEIVRKPPGRRGFQVQPERWVVERAFAWLTARRRLARDYERDPAHSETTIRWAMTDVILRRLARGRPAVRAARRPLRRTTP